MFGVIFEVHPRPENGDAYLHIAKGLYPELEQIEGFIENVRYRSVTRDGWQLSVSQWVDEKALVRWRTVERHHQAQEKGRNQFFLDYHLRVGQVVADDKFSLQYHPNEQRWDHTKVGNAKTIVLIDGALGSGAGEEKSPQAIVESLGLDTNADGLLAWDLFRSVLDPNKVLVLCDWEDTPSVRHTKDPANQGSTRSRQVRVIRDYGMFDRTESPQYYPTVLPQ